MKVAYNTCFGGFGLSCIALDEYARRKNIKLYWYREGYGEDVMRFTKVDGVPAGGAYGFQAFTKDLGRAANEYPRNSFYYPNFNELRCDTDLIHVIENLGEKANGQFSELSIAEIPDGAEYEITCHDGREAVFPPRATW